MDEHLKLTILKHDVGILSSIKDEYLTHLLETAKMLMERKGIKEEKGSEFDSLNIQYAAYLFRKRAGTETGMPEFLRRGLNDLLISQKARGL